MDNPPPKARVTPEVPQEASPIVPGHTLLRCIGKGSYGEVWLALNPMRKWTAVKLVRRRPEDDGRAYEQEFRGLVRYDDHSGGDGTLMPIRNVGRDEAAGFFYYAMELADDATTHAPLPRVSGMNDYLAETHRLATAYRPWTLSEELRQRGRLPAQECVGHGIALGTALEHLHRGNLVHRDIKPSNIIFVNGQPKLADVGLVAASDASLISLAGTSGFVPVHGAGEASGDIFALGKVLYLMATGRSIIEFPKEMADLDRLEADERRELAELQAVYDRACAFEPGERQFSARALREELELLRRNESVVTLRELERAQKRQARTVRLLILALATCGVALLVGFAAIGAWAAKRRAAQETHRRQLGEVLLSRLKQREAGWFTNSWLRLQDLAALRFDSMVAEEAVAVLAGLDATRIASHEGMESASASFSRDGRVLIGAVGTNRARLIDPNGGLTTLPVAGEGLVCWTRQGVPLRLTLQDRTLALDNAITGRRQWAASVGVPATQGSNADPVLAITSDGHYVACYAKGWVSTYNTSSGEAAKERVEDVTAMAFSDDGSLLACGVKNGATHIYTSSQLTTITALPPAMLMGRVTSLAFGRDRVVPYYRTPSSNDWLLASGDQGGGIVVWDLSRGLPRAFCRGSTWTVSALAFSPDGVTLASAGRNEPRVWDVNTGRLLLTLTPDSGGEMSALAFDATGHRLVVGGKAGSGIARTSLWEMDYGRGIQTLRGLSAPIRKLWFAANSQFVAALSDGWQIGIWDLRVNRLMYLFDTPIGQYADSAGGCFANDSQTFAFSSHSAACSYDLVHGTVTRRWSLVRGLSDQLQIDSAGRLLLLRTETSADGISSLWRLYSLNDADQPVLLHEAPKASHFPIEVALAAKGNRFLVWDWGPKGRERTIHGYDVKTGDQLWQATSSKTGWGLHVVLDPTGGYFCYVLDDAGGTRILDFSDFRTLSTKSISCRALSPNGRDVASDRAVTLDKEGDSEWIPMTTDWGELRDASSFSPDGTLLAWGTDSGMVLVADIQELRRRINYLNH